MKENEFSKIFNFLYHKSIFFSVIRARVSLGKYLSNIRMRDLAIHQAIKLSVISDHLGCVCGSLFRLQSKDSSIDCN